MKHLVVCLDGTGNHPGQTDEQYIQENNLTASAVESNVLKIWCLLTNRKEKYRPEKLVGKDEYKYYGLIGSIDIGEQFKGEALYINGVGTQGGRLVTIFDGAFGNGISLRIRDAYRFIAERYSKGDKISLFGFSRGAYAARSLAGFIEHVGLPNSGRILPESAISELYESYKKGAKYNGAFSAILSGDVEIEFLGLWDTVASLGFGNLANDFHKTSSSSVKFVRHALALDEKRQHFQPIFWDVKNNKVNVKEVWFAGAHSNVGGGYQVEKLSNVSYIWMLREFADSQGFSGQIEKLPAYMSEAGDVEGKWQYIRDSFYEFYENGKIILTFLRKGNVDGLPRRVTKGQMFHPSVYEWMSFGYNPLANGAAGQKLTQQSIRESLFDAEDWPLAPLSMKMITNPAML